MTVGGGSIALPFLPVARPNAPIDGAPGTQLESYLADTVTVPEETIDEAETRASRRPRGRRRALQTRDLHVGPASGVEVALLPRPVLARARDERRPQPAGRRRLEVA